MYILNMAALSKQGFYKVNHPQVYKTKWPSAPGLGSEFADLISN